MPPKGDQNRGERKGKKDKRNKRGNVTEIAVTADGGWGSVSCVLQCEAWEVRGTSVPEDRGNSSKQQ